MKQIGFIFIMILLSLLSVNGQELDSFNAYHEILKDQVKTTFSYRFNNTTGDMKLSLPSGVTSLQLSVDGVARTANITNLENGMFELSLPLISSLSDVKLSFYTPGEIKKFESEKFISDVELPLDTKLVDVLVSLPPGSYINPAAHDVGMVSPRPTSIISDGKHIIIKWKFHNVKAFEPITTFVMYDDSAKSVWYWMIIPILMFVALILIRVSTSKITPSDVKTEYLKEDEKIIVNVLKDKEGQTTQATLRVITGISKATLSRILSELEQRNIVHKEKRGNKNLVSLRYNSFL